MPPQIHDFWFYKDPDADLLQSVLEEGDRREVAVTSFQTHFRPDGYAMRHDDDWPEGRVRVMVKATK